MSSYAGDALCGTADALPEPDYDYLDFSFDSETDCAICGDTKKKSVPNHPDYILGTLVVRVAAARDIEPVNRGGIGQILFGGNSPTKNRRSTRSRNGISISTNPYAIVRYGGQAQRTTEVFDTTDPVWPRGENMYFDVSLPDANLSQNGAREASLNAVPAVAAAPAESNSDEGEDAAPPKPILTMALFHATGAGPHWEDKYPSKGSKQSQGDSDDPFLGMASIDVTQVLTGKVAAIDKWIPLKGTENSTGRVRLICEYEATDPPPRVGDRLRFTRFCPPAALYPIPPGLDCIVKESEGDNLLLSYETPEGWECTFSAHRFMFVCEERYQGAIEAYQQDIANLTERLAYSPLVSTVAGTVERIPDEGLLHLGANAMTEGASLLGRWFKGGIGTAVGDFVYATNLDGRFNPDHLALSPSNSTVTEEEENTTTIAEDVKIETGLEEAKVPEESEPLPGMPCCPITGEPMIDPVVAADGHTYERSAIQRWLQTSNKSPLTGALLPHKNLVTNYGLVSSLQVAAPTSRTTEVEQPKVDDVEPASAKEVDDAEEVEQQEIVHVAEPSTSTAPNEEVEHQEVVDVAASTSTTPKEG